MTRYVLAPGRAAAERLADALRGDGWHVHSGLDEPTTGWRLDRGRHVCVSEVKDRQMVEAALLLAVRGAGIVAWTESREHAAELYDGLSRLGQVELVSADARPTDGLAPDQLRMLELLAEGATQVEVADHLGWSRRTVARRLAEARHTLGAQSTAQAVVVWRRQSVADD